MAGDHPIPAVCPTVEAVRAKLSARAALGLGKYGVTLADAGLTRLAALQHAQDEAMDLANYLETLIQQEQEQVALSDAEITAVINAAFDNTPIAEPHAFSMIIRKPTP